MNKKIYKIVLTGGPCGGKTSAIAKIKEHFEARGYRVLTISEVATDFIAGGISPTSCGSNKDFQEVQVAMQLSKEKAYIRAAETMPCDKLLIVCDRGVFDNLAYMTKEQFSDIIGGLGYSESRILAGYDAVFHMETAATVGAYTTKNNSSRTESAEEAIMLDRKIQSAWADHDCFKLIPNRAGFEEKLSDLIEALEAVLECKNAAEML